MTEITIFTTFKNMLFELAKLLISFFPNSPFATLYSGIEVMPALGWLNWFVPIDQFAIVGEGWLTCIGLYYLYSTIARTTQLIP